MSWTTRVALLLLVPRCDGYNVTIFFPVGVHVQLAGGRPGHRTTAAAEVALAMAREWGAERMAPVSLQYSVLTDLTPYALQTTLCEEVEDGVFALVGTHTQATAETCQALTTALRVPFVTLGVPLITSPPEMRMPYGVYLTPSLGEALLSAVRYYGWEQVYYLYRAPNPEARDRFQELLILILSNVTLNTDIRLRLLPVKDMAHAHTMVQKTSFRDAEGLKIIVDVETYEFEELLKLEKKSPGGWREHHYLYARLGLDEMDVPSLYELGRVANVSGYTMVERGSSNVTSFTEQLSAKLNVDVNKLSHETALAADSITLVGLALASLEGWASLASFVHVGRAYYRGTRGMQCARHSQPPWPLGDRVLRLIRQTQFEGLTGHVAFDDAGLRKDYELALVEITRTSGMAETGTWKSKTKKIEVYSTPIRKLGPPKPAPKGTLIVTSILTRPFLMRRKGNYIGNDQYEGYCADLTYHVANVLNLTYKIVPVADGNYGVQSENGSWNGMVGALIRGEADLAIAPLTITSVRQRVIDFTKPYMQLGISIMLKKTSTQTFGVFFFMYPLSSEIWMCVIFAYIGVSVVLFFVSRLSAPEWRGEGGGGGQGQEEGADRQEASVFTITNSLWFSLGALLQQGCDIEPKSVPGRVVGTVWWFFILIIVSSYTANLAAFLTMVRLKSNIESADDLAKQTTIKYGTYKGGSTEDFFKTSSVEIYQKMWNFMSQEPGVFARTNEEGIRRVRESKGYYAFLLESPLNEYENQRLPCDTARVGRNLDSKGYGIGTPLGSNLSEDLTVAVLNLQEKGILDELQKEWWLTKGQCGENPSKNKATTSSLQLNVMAGVFFVLVAGLVLGALIAAVQLTYHLRTPSGGKTTAPKTPMCGDPVKSIKARLRDKNQSS